MGLGLRHNLQSLYAVLKSEILDLAGEDAVGLPASSLTGDGEGAAFPPLKRPLRYSAIPRTVLLSDTQINMIYGYSRFIKYLVSFVSQISLRRSWTLEKPWKPWRNLAFLWPGSCRFVLLHWFAYFIQQGQFVDRIFVLVWLFQLISEVIIRWSLT